MIEKKILQSSHLPKPSAPYSVAVRKGNMAFMSGIISLDKSGNTKGRTIQEQTENVLTIIKDILVGEGSGLNSVVKTTVYLSDFSNYQGMNEVYSRYFPDEPPARATVGVRLVKDEWLVEIDAIAML